MHTTQSEPKAPMSSTDRKFSSSFDVVVVVVVTFSSSPPEQLDQFQLQLSYTFFGEENSITYKWRVMLFSKGRSLWKYIENIWEYLKQFLQDYFNQTYNKSFLGEGNSSVFKLSALPFSNVDNSEIMKIHWC